MSESSVPDPAPREGFGEIVRRLTEARSLVVLTHARPDGDGLGSMAALVRSARAAGRSAHPLSIDPVPEKLAFLFPVERPAGAGAFETLADAADAVVVLDTCSYSQLDRLADPLGKRAGKVLVVDHHRTADGIGDARWIDPSAAAVGVMVDELLTALGWPIDEPAAEALMTAVTTDTGWLRFANTDARALHAMARWIDRGVRTDRLYQTLYQTDRPARLRLIGRMLGSLELFCDDRLAAMRIGRADFAAAGASAEDTENLVNESLRIGRVDTALLLSEQDDGVIRVSLRSRDLVDVSDVAGRFGGGGHARAAGFRAQEDIDALKDRLVAACIEVLARTTQ